MARLFISHSSRNNDKAIEVRDWLANNGWSDVFLDLDPERGIAAGQRWKDALQKAAWRCEVVLALVSKEWIASSWCKSEVDAARMMGKKVIAALVGIDRSEVPPDLTDEQYVDLTGDPDAYRRLKEGLKRAGLDPTTFPFPPGRRPYPGFAYLEEDDAAIFFGRDAQIVRGLDEVRRLARAGVSRMLVILGASGSGKSSFLRAGLWPRLKRDDLAWLPLPIIRPERAAISGAYGLAQALYETISDPRFAQGMRQRDLPRSRGDIEDFIEKTDDGLVKLLSALRDIAQSGFSGENAAPRTILLAIDQGEELFNEESRVEARRFIDILTKMLAADPRTLAILVMRSDAFPLVQNEPALAALPKDTLTLDMMLEGSYRAVIEGPARLVEPPLKIDPLLTDALLEDISGQDALPLLAFTLAHLYDNYRADNELTLASYEKIGRVRGVIDKTVAQAFTEAVARGEAPKDEKAQLALARSAFIPHLAQVNAVGQFARRVAARDIIPAEARPLIDRFADQRLLTRDRRKGADQKDVDVLEVAHEALLRQPPFSDWLADDREFLMWRERLSQARVAFKAEQRGPLAGRELAIARGYLQTREREIEPADQAFIRDSIAEDDRRLADEAEQERKRQAAEREEQERRVRDAERIAAERKRTTWVALAGLVVAVLVAAAALWQYFRATEATRLANIATEQAQTNADQANANLREAQIARGAADEAKKDALAHRDRAVQAEEQAKANLREAQITQSLFLADEARQQRAADPTIAALLALEALPDGVSGIHRPYVPEAELQLDSAWRDLRERLILGHEGKVTSAAFSPDGRRVATASGDGTGRIWDAMSGKAIGEPLRGHEKSVMSVAFSPDGQRVVTASLDTTARIWDAASGKAVGEPLKGDAGVMSVAFSPDGQRIVTGSLDATARIWDVATGKAIGEALRGHDSAVNSAAFSPDGKRIVTASSDKTARIWDAETGKPIHELRGHGSFVFSAAFSADGQRIVTASEDGSARIWDAATGKAIGEPLGGHEEEVMSAAFSPDGQRIVTASGRTARIWDAATGKPIGEPLKGHEYAVTSATFSSDGKRIVTSSEDRTARVWDAASRELVGLSLRGHDGQVCSAAFSSDSRRIVTASWDRTARIWDAARGKPIGEPLKGHEGAVNRAAFSPDGKRVVTASQDRTARIWNAATAKPIGEPLRGHGGDVWSVAFSPDGKRIVTASSDKTARVWDAATAEPVGEPFMGHEDAVRTAVFSPDGERIVTASDDETARIWDAATAKLIGELRGHEGAVTSAAFSPDGTRIVTASADNTGRIWDAASGKPVGEPLKGHDGAVYSAAFSPDGTRIVTASSDYTARIWDGASGQPIGEPLRGHEAWVMSAAFSPDGQRIVTASLDETARVWDVFPNTQSFVSHAKAAIQRCLTLVQRKAFFLSPEPPPWCIEMEKWPYDTPEWKRWLADNRAGMHPTLPTVP